MTITKSLGDVRVKDADRGIVEAVISTFGVIDLDGDVTSKSTFKDGTPVVISAYGHTSWAGALPYGTGKIRTTDTECIFEGQFLLDTTHGRDAFLSVKGISEAGLQQWSYSLENTVAHKAKLGDRVANLIDSTDVTEVSPVLKGASIDTRTLSTKGTKQLNSSIARMLRDAGKERWGSDTTYVYPTDYDVDAGYCVFCVYDDTEADRMIRVDFTMIDDSVDLGADETDVEEITSYAPKGSKFSEHFDFALRGVKQLTEMAVERLAHRAAEGKSISEQVEAHDALTAALAPLKAAIDDATQPTPDDEIEADDVFAHDLVASLIAQGA